MNRRVWIGIEYLIGPKMLKGLGSNDAPPAWMMRGLRRVSEDRWIGWGGDEFFYHVSSFLWLLMFQAAHDKAVELTLSKPGESAMRGRVSYRGDYPDHELAPYPASVYPDLVRVVLTRGRGIEGDSEFKCGSLTQLAEGNSNTVFANWRFQLNHGDGTVKFFLTSGPFKK